MRPFRVFASPASCSLLASTMPTSLRCPSTSATTTTTTTDAAATSLPIAAMNPAQQQQRQQSSFAGASGSGGIDVDNPAMMMSQQGEEVWDFNDDGSGEAGNITNNMDPAASAVSIGGEEGSAAAAMMMGDDGSGGASASNSASADDAYDPWDFSGTNLIASQRAATSPSIVGAGDERGGTRTSGALQQVSSSQSQASASSPMSADTDLSSSVNNMTDANVIESEDPGLIFAAEALCDDFLTCKTDVLRHFARSRGAKSNVKVNMVSELIDIASKTVSNPTSRSVARRILGSDIELPANEGVRSAWTNETLEASMLEAAAVRKAQFSFLNYNASLRATSTRVNKMSQRLLRALQDDFSAVSHAAVKGVHREYVESAKQIIERHDKALSSLVAVFSTMLTNRVEKSDVPDFISSADIQSRAVFLGLIRPTTENSTRNGGGGGGDSKNSSSQQQQSGSSSDITSSSSGSTSSSSNNSPTSSLDHLMTMLDDVVTEVEMRRVALKSSNGRFHNAENRETLRKSIQSFKLRQIAMKRDALAVRRALGDVPPWVTEMARQFEVWETLVRSDIEDLRRAPPEVFDLILVNIAATVASDKLHEDEQIAMQAAAAGGGSSGGLSASSMMSNTSSSSPDSGGAASGGGTSTVPAPYRQALRDALTDFADEATADTIILRLNAYAAGKSTLSANRPVIKQGLFRSVHVTMHGMVTDDISEPPFERVAMILNEFTRTINRSERIASIYHLLVQLTESMYFHLRFAAVFPRLSEADKNSIRNSGKSLELPLTNFETQQGITPLPVSGVAFFCIVMLYFCMRPPATVAATVPIAFRLESCTSIDELAVMTLTSLSKHTVRSLPLSHPPRMTYTSWIDSEDSNSQQQQQQQQSSSVTDMALANPSVLASSSSASASKSSSSSTSDSSSSSSSSVYRLLPSDAVKSSTSGLMLTSRAPIIRSLDAISRIPLRINKYVLYVQEAIIQEGYAFGKIRASFYPLSYARMQNGEITAGSPYAAATADSNNNNNNNNDDDGDDVVGLENDGVAKKNKDGSEVKAAQRNKTAAAAAAEADLVKKRRNAAAEASSSSQRQQAAREDQYQQQQQPQQKRKLFSHRLHRKFLEEQSRNWRELLDTRSPRVHHIQALRQARALVNVARVYFPNNMDFRGRMYPMPGRLNHTGSDPFRASLEFADPKPLGKVGVYWLKVHLANKMGQTKISFADRVRWVDEHIADVIQSAESPLSGDRWWQEGEEPFQALTACKELADALKESTGAENFLSRLPVAVDGSYNGLQHYSAIGRDEAGGALVNLVPQKLPSDAYTGILKEMMKTIVADAAKDHAVAQRCIGTGRGMDKNHVRRKTIKQSIMTQVYGVTDYGMAEQIRGQLVNQNKAHGLWTNAEITEMSGYLRDKVNESLGLTFGQTQQCRTWLAKVSALIWKCQPPELRNAFSWTTPLGLIVRQPYRKGIETSVFTPVGYSRIKGSPLEPASQKQLSALAPNIIHSLDATHLAMTALEMQNQGLSMMAVHDSFWTYAADLPQLSSILREQFVQLYTNFDPLLEMKTQWEELFFMDLRRHGVVLPDPPEKGTLDLNLVKASPYFFS